MWREKLGLRWTLHGDGRSPLDGQIVAPNERLNWALTGGLGIQHVLAMFGATFVFPIVMGLDPNLSIMMSGVATVVFLHVTRGAVPSYLGTSAAFVGAVAAIRAGGGSSADVTGAILVAGLTLMIIGIIVDRVGARVIQAIFPPVVSGAVVLLIGFNLAPVVAGIYWPQDQWVALATMAAVLISRVIFRGFAGRVAVFLGLLFGIVLSVLLDIASGPITSPDGSGEVATRNRMDFTLVAEAPWFGLPAFHTPEFSFSATALVLPAVIALIAENTGHVKAVSEITRTNLDSSLGRALAGDGIGTALSGFAGGGPTTTFAENIGVMATTRVYSTAAYWVAAGTAILLGLCPKFGAIVAAIPGGVLGGITVILYGIIGLLGANIWLKNEVDFGKPENLFPAAAGIIAGIGGAAL